MSNPSTSAEPGKGGVSRVLILGANADDPMWVICSVSLPSDVRPAAMDGRRYRDWDEVTEWVRRQTGETRVSLLPIAAAAWRIDSGDPRLRAQP